MSPYLITSPDDHRQFIKKEWHIEAVIARYIESHPYFKRRDFVVHPISWRYYKKWNKNKGNPLWWILEQGDPLSPISAGRRELLMKMIGIFPTPIY